MFPLTPLASGPRLRLVLPLAPTVSLSSLSLFADERRNALINQQGLLGGRVVPLPGAETGGLLT